MALSAKKSEVHFETYLGTVSINYYPSFNHGP